MRPRAPSSESPFLSYSERKGCPFIVAVSCLRRRQQDFAAAAFEEVAVVEVVLGGE